MDLKKTGAFIADQRRRKGLTQKELAALLGVTDKAVSRWETGKGFPEVSILEPLSKALEVSIAELVNGEWTVPEQTVDQNDRAVLSAFAYTRGMLRSLAAVIFVITGIGLILAPLYVLGGNDGIFFVLGIACVATAIVLRFVMMPSEKLSRVLSLLFLVLALILELIPGSAVLIFAAGPEERFVEYVSCFNLTLVGYANGAPFIAGVLTVGTCVLSALLLFDRAKRTRNGVFIATIIASLLMFVPTVLFGLSYLTPLSLAITLLLFASAAFQASANARAIE